MKPSIPSQNDTMDSQWVEELTAAGIPLDRLDDLGIREARTKDDLPEWARWIVDKGQALPALVFDWTDATGETIEQVKPYRPIMVNDEPRKYVWPKGRGTMVHIARQVEEPVGVLVVEGTKQSRVAALNAPDGWVVAGLGGCHNWMSNGVIDRHLGDLVEGLPVVATFDADLTSNRQVYDAGRKMADALALDGATEVRFARIPGSGTTGLDDMLGSKDADKRGKVLERLIDSAKPLTKREQPKAPKPRGGTATAGGERCMFIDADGTLLLEDIARDIILKTHTLVADDGTFAVYQKGVYRRDPSALVMPMLARLRNDYRRSYASAIEELVRSQLLALGRRLPTHTDEPLLNVLNGMVDLRTGDLLPHDPKYRSAQQLDITYDPNAEAPTYLAWAEAIGIAGVLDDLEEVCSTMLDASATPTKAAFLYGPSRSGKSTYIRLMLSLVGPENTSAVTLHQLSRDQFAAANVYGAMLNAAADLSADHIEDLSTFKMLTGEDVINANRKYGRQFQFTNKALFMFSANEVPSVGESSRAYLERVKPFAFHKTFAGAEDSGIERHIKEHERAGLLKRLVDAGVRMRDRGTYSPTDPATLAEFADASDRVSQWMRERWERSMPPNGTKGTALHTDFRRWASDNGVGDLGRNKFYRRLETHGVSRWNTETERGVFGLVRLTKFDKSTNHPALLEERGSANLTVPKSGVPQKSGVPEERGSAPETVSADGSLTVPEGETVRSRTAGVGRSDQGGTPEADGFDGSGPQTLQMSDTSNDTDESVCEKTPLGLMEEKRQECLEPRSSETPVVFDLETGSVTRLYSAGPEYAKLTVANGAVVTPSSVVAGPRPLVAHNGYQFDFHVLARHFGLDLTDPGLVDTKVLAALHDPAPYDMKPGQIERHFSLDNVAARLGFEGKTDDLKRLARKYGKGADDPFMEIPNDDPEYIAYCKGDVEATAAILALLPMTPYAEREHRLLGRLAASVTHTGFRVDTDLLQRRFDEGEAVLAEGRRWLVDTYGLPVTRKDGSPSAKPHMTQAGKEAIFAAFADLGVDPDEWPWHMRTDKGKPSLGQNSMQVFLDNTKNPGIRRLAEVIQQMNGVRSVYGTVLDTMTDGRVHPTISARQASGRLSITEPGLTVFGKRGGKWRERQIFLPEPGDLVVAIDLSQVDARAVAALSGDEAYRDLFLDRASDAHAEVARRVWGTDANGRRDQAKVIGHAWNYGAGIPRLVQQTGLPEQTIVEFDEGMRRDFPDLVRWRDEIRREAETGDLMDNGWGRKMRPDPEKAWTQGPALMGQGAARDIMMEGILRLPDDVFPMLRAVVHDEIVLSAPADSVDDVVRLAVEALEMTWMGMPIYADVSKPAGNWGDCYSKEN